MNDYSEHKSGEFLLEVKDLATYFFTHRGVARAVDGVSFNIAPGEVLALVGESGSGKTVTGRSILRLVSPPGRIVRGKVLLNGRDLIQLDDKSIRNTRGKEISLIQQDPVASLNPTFKIKDQIGDVLRIRGGLTGKKAEYEAISMLKQVGIANSIGVLQKYPHQLSGGMCQRIVIAMAFAFGPSLVIADEPTTSLDVITQNSIIQLMKRSREEFNTSILFITHNLLLASMFAHRIAVMYAGKIVEVAHSRDLFTSPRHPYSQNLINVIPKLGETYEKFPTLIGSQPDPMIPIKGCAFYPRCPLHRAKCLEGDIPQFKLSDSHSAACIALEDVAV